jgi:hypothetical protein
MFCKGACDAFQLLWGFSRAIDYFGETVSQGTVGIKFDFSKIPEGQTFEGFDETVNGDLFSSQLLSE